MKIKKSQLKQIIKEELQKMLFEQSDSSFYPGSESWERDANLRGKSIGSDYEDPELGSAAEGGEYQTVRHRWQGTDPSGYRQADAPAYRRQIRPGRDPVTGDVVNPGMLDPDERREFAARRQAEPQVTRHDDPFRISGELAQTIDRPELQGASYGHLPQQVRSLPFFQQHYRQRQIDRDVAAKEEVAQDLPRYSPPRYEPGSVEAAKSTGTDPSDVGARDLLNYRLSQTEWPDFASGERPPTPMTADQE